MNIEIDLFLVSLSGTKYCGAFWFTQQIFQAAFTVHNRTKKTFAQKFSIAVDGSNLGSVMLNHKLA